MRIWSLYIDLRVVMGMHLLCMHPCNGSIWTHSGFRMCDFVCGMSGNKVHCTPAQNLFTN